MSDVVAVGGGRYRIERRLGAGGMASVFLARDDELGRAVAVKLLAEHLTYDEGTRARFVREARLAAALAHPNIVTIFDAGDEGARPYIVMEYVEGQTLADRLRAGPLAPGVAIDVGMQVCAGLAHAHAGALVHRDVKPQNLLVRADGVVKIADFGIARLGHSTRVTEVGTVLGTAAYLAPEQAAGEEVTAAADIYALGAVLYQALAGRPPYSFETLAELVVRQATEPPTPLREIAPTVPVALERVVLRCLERSPHARPESAAEVAHELALASPEPPTQPLPSRVTAATRVLPRAEAGPVVRGGRPRARRARLWVAVLATLAAAVALAGLGVAASDGGDDEPAPTRVERVEPGATPEQGARNLAEWLERYSG